MSVEEFGYIDEASGWAHVPASFSVRQVEERLRGKGRTLGPQPPSVLRGTVREWLEGPLAGRWVEGGRLAPCVASVRIALDDGSILRTLPSPRSAAGPSLGQVFLGNEGAMGELNWVVLRSRRLWRKNEERTFVGDVEKIVRWLEFESQRIAPPVGVELQGGERMVASLHFPADTEKEKQRAEAAAATARALGLVRGPPLGVSSSERRWEREIPRDAWRECLVALGEGKRLGLCRIARESAIAVTTEEVGENLRMAIPRDPALADLESRLAALLRPH